MSPHLNIPKILLGLATHRGVEPETISSIRDAQAKAPGKIAEYTVFGVPGLGLARNITLTQAMGILRQPDSEFEVVALCDDDMQFEPEQLFELAFYAHAYQRPVSGIYSLRGGEASAFPVRDGAPLNGAPLWMQTKRWLTGLGLMVIPVPLLFELEKMSEIVSFDGKDDITCFTWCGPGEVPLHLRDKSDRDKVWWGEDTRLSARLGALHGEEGICLAPIAIGHKKPRILMPDEKTLRQIREGTFSPTV